VTARPTRHAYREAVADIVRSIKAQHRLSNEALGDVVGCHEDTIKNAENQAGNLDAVTLLALAWAFGEEAIAPVRSLYLRSGPDLPTALERLERIEREAAALKRELEI
jgi:hypothetical protein